MSGQMARQFLAGVVSAAFLWFAAVAGFCPVATGAEGGLREDETPPDLEYIRGKAEAGVSKAQTLLADFYASTGDFTNAVLWYRKAAAQDDVGAQLTLASCLVTGQGTAKNPTEAARWLREAARLIESPAPKPPTERVPTAVPPVASMAAASRRTLPGAEGGPTSIVPAPPGPRSIVITKATVATQPATNNSPATPDPAPLARIARVQRVRSLSPAAPDLQETRPVLKSYSDSR